MEIRTSLHTVTRARLLRTAGRPVALLAVGAGTLLIAAGGASSWTFTDMRWLVAALMLVMVAVPAVLLFLFIHYGMSPRCLPMVYPHTVLLNDSGIHVRATVPGEPVHTLKLDAAWSDVARARAGLKALTIKLKGTPPGLLYIPYDALPDPKADIPAILRKCGFGSKGENE